MLYITPTLIMIIVTIALIKRKSVYSDFIDGVQGGMKLLVDIFPPLLAMLVASAMLKASGFLDIIFSCLEPMTEKMGIPKEIMPLVIIRPMSGSGSIGLLSNILNEYGADSIVGRMASVMCGSTETTFYCLAVYFAKTRIKNVTRAVIPAVIGDLAGIVGTIIVLKIFAL